MTPDRVRLDPGLLLVLVGAVLVRFRDWSAVALDIFDSGAYAVSAQALASGLFPALGYPTQHLLSPPFHFGSAGAVMRVIGTSDAALLGLSAVFGVATVGLVHLYARAVFGREAALVAAALVAFSDFHIVFSRSGMTDVTFGFWLLLAIWCFAEAEQRESWAWAVLAGLSTGAAWNTKYHGWLAVVAAAIAVTAGARRLGRRALLRRSAGVAAGGLVAAVLYLPWAYHAARQPGGYEQMVATYSAYLQPLEIPGHIWQHLRLQMALDGWTGRIGAALAAVWLAASAPPPRRRTAAWRAVAVALLALLVGPTVLAGIAAPVAVVALLRSSPDARGRALLAFFGLFVVLTPVYQPYARLSLPLLLASWILAAGAVTRFVRGPGTSDEHAWPRPGRRTRLAGAVGLAAIVGVCVSLRAPWTAAATYRPQTGLRTAAAGVAEIIPEESTTLVWAEPALVFYLRNRMPGVFSIHDPREIARYAELGRPVYLLSSIYAARTAGEPGTREWLAANGERMLPVGVVPVEGLSNVRLINDWSGADAGRIRRGDFEGYEVRVFRIRDP